jgi:alpha-glucosidase
MRKLFFTTLLSFGSLTINAQTLNQPLGNFTSLKKDAKGLIIIAGNAKVEVRTYSQSIIRIRISNKVFEKDFSYAVIKDAPEIKFILNEEKDKITLKTDSLSLIINKNPLRFRLYNKDMKLLNEDDSAFGTSWLGTEVTSYKKLQEGERFIGLGEKTGNLDRRGTAYTNWNNDYFGYPANADPLYQTIPFYIGIHSKLVYGIFLDNSYKSTFNFGASNDRFSYFSADDGEMNYYLISGSNVKSIIGSYTFLTGRMELPPLWSLGYQQSRWSYYPDKEVLSLAKTFRDKKIPADVIYLDVHYMDAYKVFTWHSERFPEPKKLLDELKAMGFHTVVIVDPGIKVEKGYSPYEEGVKNNYFVKYPDQTLFTGEVWPGWCHFPDFTNPSVRTWWGGKFKGLVDAGIEGFWNDMNEPASWGNKNPDLIEFNYEGLRSTHKKAHNIYGMQMVRSTFEGSKTLFNGKRPFCLTRAGFAGVQRYSAVWTGDNVSSDEHMLAGVRLVNSMGISGIPFAGVDIGGFFGEPSTDLYTRWMTIGTFTPFFRGHTMYGTKDQEPWSFGEEVENTMRESIGLRYKLLPYIYSTFYEASQTGIPVSRSLAIDYTFDPFIYQEQNQHEYMFGQSILVCPVSSTQKFAKVYLPQGNWYKFGTNELYEGGKQILVEAPMDKLPVFVKEGSVIPMQSLIQYSSQKASDTLQIDFYPGQTNFTYYEDDGQTYSFQNGDYFKLNIKGTNDDISFEKAAGNRKSKYTYIRIKTYGLKNSKDILLNTRDLSESGKSFKLQ